MRRISVALLAAVSTTALTQIAYAAPPAAPPTYNWTGTSAGVGGGYGGGHSNQTDPGVPSGHGTTTDTEGTAPIGDGSIRAHGGAIGGALGYNWQMGQWVYGIEGDYSWSDVKGSSSTCGANSSIPHSCGTELQSFGTLRARIGYAMGVTGNWLPYVTGGLAVGEVKGWDSLFPSSGSDFRAGWTIGGGVEVGLVRNWSFKLEYLYMDLGDRQTFNIVPGVPENVSFKANIIRAGINYRF